MTRYVIPIRSQVNAFMQRTMARLDKKDVHRWVFVHSLTPEVECAVSKWLLQRLNVFYCELQVMYTPQVRSTSPARTHIVLNNTPSLSLSRNDEAVEVDASGLIARDAVRALIKATGLNPHMAVCGWPFCLSDLDDLDDTEGGDAA